MIFGDKTTFAIEAVLEGIDDRWFFGHLRFWVDGVAIGDFDDSSDLAGSARWGRHFLAASARRTRSDLDSTTEKEVYRILYGRFVDDGDADPAEHMDPDPFLLDDVGESALRDRASVLALRTRDGWDRIIVHDLKSGRTFQKVITPGFCNDVTQYCGWVESLGGARK